MKPQHQTQCSPSYNGNLYTQLPPLEFVTSLFFSFIHSFFKFIFFLFFFFFLFSLLMNIILYMKH